MKTFSKHWKSSKKTRKQRKYRINAPLHTRHKFLGARLSAELTKKYQKRTMPVRVGDTVKVARGQFTGKIGKIEKANTKDSKITIEGVDFVKKEGTKTRYPIHASNLIITTLNLDDKKRTEKLQPKKEGAK